MIILLGIVLLDDVAYFRGLRFRFVSERKTSAEHDGCGARERQEGDGGKRAEGHGNTSQERRRSDYFSIAQGARRGELAEDAGGCDWEETPVRLTVARPSSLGGRRGSMDASKGDANILQDRRTHKKKIIGAARPRSGWRGASGSDVVNSSERLSRRTA
ncbi:MAG TPA: hypothetical protein VNC50_18150 [Planctomycetia bacterium]|nr:hypothetical protein [Planctomycetia bacterium]